MKYVYEKHTECESEAGEMDRERVCVKDRERETGRD